MYEADQQMRSRSLDNPDKWDEKIDRRNTAQLKKILKEIGWPSISKVGKIGSSYAWTLAQHADHDLRFQKKCLGLMKSESKNEINKANIAFLEDRIAVSDGRPQVYGTQFYKDSNGQIQPRPILDLKNIERLRKVMGLETFDEYRRCMGEEDGRNGA